MDFNMYVPTKILFGAGTLNELGKQQLPGKKAVIIISNGKSTRANGYLSRTEEQLAQAGVATSVFDKIQPNPLKETVMEGAAFVKAQDADFIVALGGGSVIDSAKAIAVMAANPGDLWDYIASGTGKGQPIKNKPLPIVAISTTAGTGSEADAGCVITNPETNEKVGLKTPDLFPVLCIEDPELMKSVPAHYTAYQGFDALSAYHPNLPHGAGLIMLSRAYFGNVIAHHACDERFVRMAKAMGMENADKPEDFLTVLQKLLEDCGVADLKMSDYGITPDEFPKMADNAMGPMGGLFACDRVELTKEDVIGIYQKSYK